MGPSSVQKAALALLHQPWQPVGSNAFDDVWLLDFDVPEAERAAQTDADAAWLAAQPAPGFRDMADIKPFVHRAQERYQSLALADADNERLCAPRDPGCLDKVRAEMAQYRDLVDRNAQLLARVEALSHHGHLLSRLPPRIDAPFPSYQPLRLGLTADALRFTEGDVDGALASACRSMSTWRRLGVASDVLITRMIGIAYAGDGYARLLADMLRELPADHPMPQSCRVALSPPSPGEASICQAVRGEFAMLEHTMRSLEDAPSLTGNKVGDLLAPLAFDADSTIAETAPAYAAWCDAPTSARIERDVPFRAPAAAGGRELKLLRLDCLANAVGCILASISGPDMSAYQNRALDQSARFQVLATLLWLRDNVGDERPLAERVAGRPAALRGPARGVEIGPGGDTLRIRQYDTSGGRSAYWEIALPAYLLDQSHSD